jgi:hypothetical protein
MVRPSFGLPILAFAACLAASPCLAAEAAAQPPAQPALEEALPYTALPLDELDAISGGASVSVDLLTNQNLTATNSGNSIVATSVRSGDVNLSDNALSGFNGVGNFVINTGANNNLQGSISVNVVSTP